MKKKFTLLCVAGLLFGLFVTSGTSDSLLGVDFVDRAYHLFLWFLILVPMSLFALVLKDDKYKFWLKFTGIFFAISMVLVYLMPEYDSGIVSLDRELTNWFFAGVYSFISVTYFIIQFVKNKK